MADLLYPLDPSQDSPLPADDGVVSAAIAFKAAEEAKSARDLSVQQAGEVLSGVTVATQKAAEAAGHANTASAAALQVDGAVDTVLAQVDAVALAVTAVNSDKNIVAGYKTAVAADRLATQIDRQLAQSLVASFNQTWLGAFDTDEAAEAYRAANNILLADGLQYFNKTSDKTRQWKNTAWSDYDATAQQSQTNAGLAATLAGMHAAAAEQYKNSALSLSEQVTQTKVDIDAIRADLVPIFLGRFTTDSTANNTASASGLGSVDGVRYFNPNTNKIRVRAGGVWSDEVLPGVSAAAAAASATASETSKAAALAAQAAAEAAAGIASTTSIAGAKIASLTTSALRSLAVVAGKSVELLGYARANDYGSGSFVGAVAAAFNGAISGSGSIRTLTVTNITAAGLIYAGMLLSFGSNITVLKQISGDTGGNGTYAVASSQNTTTTTAMTARFVDDGGRYFVPTGGDGSTAWVRQIDFSQPVSAGWWGVKCSFTDYDHVAAQAALDGMYHIGGHLIFPPGKMRFASQVTVTRDATFPAPVRTYPASGGVPAELVGYRMLKISGWGCEVHTVGDIAGFKTGPQLSYSKINIEGFVFHNNSNTEAKAGIWAVNTRNLSIFMNTFYTSAKLPSKFASVLFEGECTLSDIDYNLFTNFGSQDGLAPYCIALYGIQNGIRITKNNLGAARKHILISNEPGQTYIPNSVIITHNAFEGGTPNTSIIGGTISGDVLTVTSIAASRFVLPGQQLSGTNVIPETMILNQLTPLQAGEATGGVGRYQISKDHTAAGTLTATGDSPFTADSLETAITLNCDHNVGAIRYMATGIVAQFNRLEKLHAFISIEGTANAVQTPLLTGGNFTLTSVVNWIKNPNNIPVNDQDTAQIGAPVGAYSTWNNQGFEWAATTPAPVTLTNASIVGDILTVGAGSSIAAHMVASGTGVNAETSILWQISGTQYGPGVYKLSSSHATPVTASIASPITLDHPDPFTYRFRQLNRGIVGRLNSDSTTLNNTLLYRHDYAQFRPIGNTASSGDLGTILGSGNATRLMKLRGINGLASGHEIAYNFTGSVTFAAEKEKLVRFPQAQTTNANRFFASISGNILTASSSSLLLNNGVAISGVGFTATLVNWLFERQATTGGVTNGTGDNTLSVSAITEVSPGVYNLSVSGVTLDPATATPGPAAVYRLYGQDYTVVSWTLAGNAPARSGTIQVSGPSLPHAGTPVTTAVGTSLPTFRYSLSGANTDRPLQEMYLNQLSELNGLYIVVLEYGGSGELSKPLRVTNKSNVGFAIDAGTGAFNYVVAIATPNGITNAPAVGDVYRVGGVVYTVTGVTLTGTAPNRVGTIQLSGPSDPTNPATGQTATLTRLNGAGDASITYAPNAVSAGYTFNVSGITTSPAAGAVYSDGTNSYTVRATSLTTTPAGYIYGTIHASAPLGTTPPASGSLARQSGTGDSTVAFSAVTSFENRITGPVRWMLVKTAS